MDTTYIIVITGIDLIIGDMDTVGGMDITHTTGGIMDITIGVVIIMVTGMGITMAIGMGITMVIGMGILTIGIVMETITTIMDQEILYLQATQIQIMAKVEVGGQN